MKSAVNGNSRWSKSPDLPGVQMIKSGTSHSRQSVSSMKVKTSITVSGQILDTIDLHIGEVQPDFKELLELFNAHRVEYMIVGG